MAIKRFVDALDKKNDIKYMGRDRIPGTNKIRTYCANASLFSRESDIRKITSKRYLEIDTSKRI